MSNIGEWEPVADDNGVSPTPDGAPEHMDRSEVNNHLREQMGANARMFRDQNGGIVSGGTGTAYTFVSTGVSDSKPYTDYAQVSFVCFEAHVDCGASPTLSIDGLAALPLVFTGSASPEVGDVKAGTVIVAQYNPGALRFEMLNARQRVFSTGTRCLFQQDSVPSGWSKITTYNDMGLRVVGTDTAGIKTDGLPVSSVMAPQRIRVENLPFVNLGNGSLAFSDSFTITASKTYGYSISKSTRGVNGSGGSTVLQNISMNEDFPDVQGTMSGNVGGSLFLEGEDVPLDFAMNYVDVIIGEAL